jgi:hypothetical protein
MFRLPGRGRPLSKVWDKEGFFAAGKEKRQTTE